MLGILDLYFKKTPTLSKILDKSHTFCGEANQPYYIEIGRR